MPTKPNSTKKTLLIGWDAADWKMLLPLMQSGALPALSKLVAGGVRGPLASLEPMISPVLWTSIATGRRAYDHGIHGFVEAKPDGSGIRPIRASKRKQPAIWNVLNRFGFSTHIINWWPSHPAESVDGLMVSNFYGIPEHKTQQHWPLQPGAVHPPTLSRMFEELQLHPNELTAEILAPFFPNYGPLDEKDSIVQSVAKILAHTCSTHNAITQTIEEEDWDFAAVYYNGLDHFLHVANRFAPPKMEGVSEEQFRKYHFVVEAALRFHDMMLERLVQLAGDNCNIILVSDHGFDTAHQRKPKLPDQLGAPSLEHQPYGVFLGYGPDFKCGEVVKGMSLLDVCPTILQLFGCPISNDLDGVVLHQALRHTAVPHTVPNFDGIPAYHSNFHQDAVFDDDEMLLQLQALGYVSDTDTDKQIMAVLRENQYYLARSHVDGGQYTKATALLSELVQQDPHALRFRYLLLHAAFQSNEGAIIQSQLEALEQNNAESDVRTQFYKGLWLLNQEKPRLAVACFDRVVAHAKDRPGLLLQIASAYNQATAFEEAFAVLSMISPDQLMFPDDWHFQMARYYVHKKAYEEAVNHLVVAIEMRFALPARHALLADVLLELGEVEDAAQALCVAAALAPGNQQYYKKMQHVYQQTNTPSLGRFLKERQQVKNEQIIVVSGLPRSGTSLMMQVLAESGFPIFSDAQRQPDHFNPKGYLEHEAVKKLPTHHDFLNGAKGKAVKVVAPLVTFLPALYSYKVVFVHRPTTEIVLSQELMKGASEQQIFAFFPLERALKLEQATKQSLQFLKQQNNIVLLEVAHADFFEQPKKLAEKLTEFFQQSISKSLINKVVDKSLYRSKMR